MEEAWKNLVCHPELLGKGQDRSTYYILRRGVYESLLWSPAIQSSDLQSVGQDPNGITKLHLGYCGNLSKAVQESTWIQSSNCTALSKFVI